MKRKVTFWCHGCWHIVEEGKGVIGSITLCREESKTLRYWQVRCNGKTSFGF